MFRLIGGAVVYGLALYGVAKLLEVPAQVGCNPATAADDDGGGVEVVGESIAGPDPGSSPMPYI